MHVYKLKLSKLERSTPGGGKGVKFEVELNAHASKLDQMLSTDLKGTVRVSETTG